MTENKLREALENLISVYGGINGGVNDSGTATQMLAAWEQARAALSTPVKDDWVWTDALVFEFAVRNQLPDREVSIDEFKQLKSLNPSRQVAGIKNEV